MSENNETRLGASPAVAIALVGLVAFASVTAAAGVAGDTAVGLSSATERTDVGGTTTFDVVVADADGGVGAYTANVTLANPAVASITAVEVGGDPGIEEVKIADDGSTVHIEAATMNTSDTGSVTIATVTVEGAATGNSDVSLKVSELGDEDGTAYAVTETSDATLDVRSSSGGNAGNDGGDSGAVNGDAEDGDANSAADAKTTADSPSDDTTTDAADENGDGETTEQRSTSVDQATTDGEPTDTGTDAGDSGPPLAAAFLLVVVLAALAAGLAIARRRR